MDNIIAFFAAKVVPSGDDEELALSEAEAASGIASRVWQGFSFFQQKTGPYVPQVVKTAAGLTGKLLQLTGKIGYQGIRCFDEALDFPNFGGTKDPLASIDKSCSRLRKHDMRFAECFEFLADQAANYYVQNAEEIKNKISDAISGIILLVKQKMKILWTKIFM